MTPSRSQLLSLLTFAALASCAGDDVPTSPAAPAADEPPPAVTPPEVRALVARLGAFVVHSDVDPSAILLPGAIAPREVPVVRPSPEAAPVVGLTAARGWGLASPATAVRAVLPRRASGAFSLRESVSGLSIEVELEGASPVEGVPHQDLLTYPGALRGADVIHRLSASGTEDFVLYANPPAERALGYRLHLERGSSLRLVANTLEVLDASGTPRLRVAPPYVVDASGTVRDAQLRVEGCEVDTDPSGPWDRPTTPPGAAQCRVEVAWDDRELTYPLLVDPSWYTTSGAMTQARYNHQAKKLLRSGRVLVAGGYNAVSGYLASAEIYDPTTGTWTVTESMKVARGEFIGALQSEGSDSGYSTAAGDVFYAIGGRNAVGALKSVEAYKELTGHWTTKNDMKRERYAAAGAAYNLSPFNGELNDFRIIAGGGFSSTGVPRREAEVFNGTTWTETSTIMNTPRAHAAATWISGYVVFSGGYTGSGATSTAERYGVISGSWSPAGTMLSATYAHSGTAYEPYFIATHVYVAGGSDGTKSINAAQIYDRASNSWALDSAGSLRRARESHSAVALSGKVHIIGGVSFSSPTSSFYAHETEIREPGVSSLYCCSGVLLGLALCPACSAQVTLRSHAPAVGLQDGRILFAGGRGTSGLATNLSQVFNPN